MLIDINQELSSHFEKVRDHRDLVLESGEDKDRAAALRVTSDLIKDLVKIQESVVNMGMINTLQQEVITALQETSPEIADRVLKALEKRLTTSQET